MIQRMMTALQFVSFQNVKTDSAVIFQMISQELLEKCRVIFQQPGERSYHIYYQIMSQTKPELIGKINATITNYKYNNMLLLYY